MLNMILLDISTGWKTAIMVVALIAVFYFFIIRPQSQKAKEEENYRKGLRKGDRVMTSGGIHATVESVSGQYAQVEVAAGTRIKVLLNTLSPIPEHKSKGEK